MSQNGNRELNDFILSSSFGDASGVMHDGDPAPPEERVYVSAAEDAEFVEVAEQSEPNDGATKKRMLAIAVTAVLLVGGAVVFAIQNGSLFSNEQTVDPFPLDAARGESAPQVTATTAVADAQGSTDGAPADNRAAEVGDGASAAPAQAAPAQAAPAQAAPAQAAPAQAAPAQAAPSAVRTQQAVAAQGIAKAQPKVEEKGTAKKVEAKPAPKSEGKPATAGPSRTAEQEGAVKPLMTVNAADIGLRFFTADAISVNNGGPRPVTLRVGDAMPTGEKIHHLDPTSMTVVTDRRVIRIN